MRGGRWSHAHDARRYSSAGRADHARDRRQAMALSRSFGGNKDGRGAVVDARRVTSRHGAINAEGRRQLGQAFEGGIRPRVLIGLDHQRLTPVAGNGHRHNLFRQAT